MKIDTNDYENAWRRKPRGFGNWLFRVGKRVVGWTCEYREAMARAMRVAREEGARRITVLS